MKLHKQGCVPEDIGKGHMKSETGMQNYTNIAQISVK